MLDAEQFDTNVDEPQTPKDSSQNNTFRTPTTSDVEQSTKKKSAQKRKRGDQDKELEILDDALNMLKSTNDLATDPYFAYGQHIANELRKYDPQTLAYVKKAFSDVLFEADMGTLFYRYHPGNVESSTSGQSTGNGEYPGFTPTSTITSPSNSEANDDPSLTIL